MQKENRKQDPPLQAEISSKVNTDSVAATTPDGLNLETVPLPVRRRPKFAKTVEDLRLKYDKRYIDGAHTVYKCDLNFELCDNQRQKKTAFRVGDDVCATLPVNNTKDGDILVDISPSGPPLTKSYFEGHTGLRVEIDGLKNARITRVHGATAKNVKPGQNYLFFRTLINGNHGTHTFPGRSLPGSSAAQERFIHGTIVCRTKEDRADS